MVNGRLVQLERGDNMVYITLTRTTALSITTAGVTVTWQNLIDAGCAVAWSGSTITVPVSGYYSLTFNGKMSTRDAVVGDILVNGVEVATMDWHTRDHRRTKRPHRQNLQRQDFRRRAGPD